MRIKKFIVCFLILCLLPMLFACGSDKEESGGAVEETVIDDKLIGAWSHESYSYGHKKVISNQVLIFDKSGEVTYYDPQSGYTTKANIKDSYQNLPDGASFSLWVNGRKMEYRGISVDKDAMECTIYDITNMEKGKTRSIPYELPTGFVKLSKEEEASLRERLGN